MSFAVAPFRSPMALINLICRSDRFAIDAITTNWRTPVFIYTGLRIHHYEVKTKMHTEQLKTAFKAGQQHAQEMMKRGQLGDLHQMGASRIVEAVVFVLILFIALPIVFTQYDNVISMSVVGETEEQLVLLMLLLFLIGAAVGIWNYIN